MPLARIMISPAVAWHVPLLVFAQMETLRGGTVVLALAGFAQSLPWSA